MSRGVNKVILLGHLGGDPQVRYSRDGKAIANLSIATSETWRDKQSGERQERTEWHRVVLFGKLGEIAGEYLKKGRQVYIEGALRTQKYIDKEGVERYATDIVASEMQMIGGNGGEPAQSRGGQSAEARAYAERSAPLQRTTGGPAGGFDDDDIPFQAPITRRNWGALS